MNLEVIRSSYFTAAFKKLSKHYRGIVDDYEVFLEDLKANPHQGVEIAPHIRKVRMAITAKEKPAGHGLLRLMLWCLNKAESCICSLFMTKRKPQISK